MHDFNKKSALCADDTRTNAKDIPYETTQTTCRRHITREFGLKSRKKIGGGENREKKTWGGSDGNILFFFLA